MSFIFKTSALTFSKISTQPAAPAAKPTVTFATPIGKAITKDSAVSSVAAALKANQNAIAIDKASKVEVNFYQLSKNYLAKIIGNLDPSALAHAFPRFKAYESLTGLTNTRPEIVMSMTFKPLFEESQREDSVSLQSGELKKFTSEGELIDAQIQMFNLKYEAFNKLISDMKQNPDAQKLLEDNESQFLSHIDRLTSDVNFLRSITLTLENLKQFFNLRNPRSRIDYSNIVYNYFKTITLDLKGEITTRFESNTNYFKILSECGFDENNVKNFSNTKIYLQSLYELKKLMVGASDEITGIDGSQKIKDTDPTSIIKTRIVDVNSQIAAISDFTTNDLRTMSGNNFRSIAAKVSRAFNSLNSIQAASADDRVALFYHVVSKEYSYSYALNDQSFARFIESSYGYKPSTNNSRMFDAFLGHPGNRIVDRVYSLSPNAAMSVAQQEKADFIVLPFENDYVDYDSSVFSPGAVYYIDEAMKVTPAGFDLTKPNEIRNIAEQQTKLQSTLYKYLIPRLQTTFNTQTAYGDTLSNSNKLFESCMNTFLDPASRQLKSSFSNSNLGILFDKASSDSYLKSLLFMYFHVRSLGIANDDAFQLSSRGMVEYIAEEIGKRLRGTTPSALGKIALSAFSNSSVSTKTASSIETELKNSSEFTNIFSAQLQAIYNTFVFSNCFTGFNDGTSKYSGMSHSVLVFSAFEMLFSTFARLNEKRAVSYATSTASATVASSVRAVEKFHLKLVTSYSLARKSFFEIVSNKLKFENDLTLKLVLLNLNTFDSLQNAVRNSIITLQKPDNVKLMNEILNIVESNEQLSLLINDSQINIVKNAVDDINSKFDARVRSNYKRETNRLDLAASYMKSTHNDLVLFDDFLVPTEVKQILYEYFSTEKFSINRAFNSRILSVGIPQGFDKYLREKVALKNINQRTLNEKEGDIIKVNVYKVDVRYQNLVFRPQSFLFELSRFVSKDYSSYLPVREGASEEDILKAIPMRDYSIINDLANTAGTTYGKNSSLYQSSEYDFLTIDQKNDLMKSHIRSHMLELYIKLLTGFSVNELDFYIDDAFNDGRSMSPLVVNQLIDQTVVKHNPPATLGKRKKKPIQLLGVTQLISEATRVAGQLAKKAETQHKVIVDVAKTRTLYSDALLESRKLMKPKMFDRVFNVFVDPDDFEIDQQETIKTESGRDLLESLFSSGKIIEIRGQSIQRATQVNVLSKYKIVDKNPNQNEPVFEKYFVTLETVLGDIV